MQYNSASISWKNIDWFNGTIKVRGKGEEKIKYINDNPKIRISSGDEKPAAKWNFDTEDLIVHYICDTIISKVRKVLKAAGMYVHGRAVHAFRHTFATETLKNNNIRVTQEALDHKDISTTQIYTHIVAEQKNLRRAKNKESYIIIIFFLDKRFLFFYFLF